MWGWARSLRQASRASSTTALQVSNTRLESRFWRRSCQTFSTGFRSGAREGGKRIVTVFGTAKLLVVCQLAGSSRPAPPRSTEGAGSGWRSLWLRPFDFVLKLMRDQGYLTRIGDRGVNSTEDARRYLNTAPIYGYGPEGHGFNVVETRDRGTRVGMQPLLFRRSGNDGKVPARESSALPMWPQGWPRWRIAGAPDTIRTCDLHLRRVALYPAELRVPATRLAREAVRGQRGPQRLSQKV